MRRLLLGLLSPGLTAAFVLSSPREARAGAAIGADVDFGIPVGGPASVDSSFAPGFGGRLGYRFGLGPVFLQPEIGGNYAGFVAGSGAASAGGHAVRMFAGARFGLGKTIQPQIYGHAGYGWLGSAAHGPAAEVGFALDFKLIPFFSFGAHVGYNAVTVTSLGFSNAAMKWVNPGLHVGLVF